MGTFEVQPAGALLHCYVTGTRFDSRAPSRVWNMPGVRSVHLVTADREPARWCLIVQPDFALEEGNAQALVRLAGALARRFGCDRVVYLRHLERSDGGQAHDIYDCLKR